MLGQQPRRHATRYPDWAEDAAHGPREIALRDRRRYHDSEMRRGAVEVFARLGGGGEDSFERVRTFFDSDTDAKCRYGLTSRRQCLEHARSKCSRNAKRKSLYDSAAYA